jgi:hypothetical protein
MRRSRGLGDVYKRQLYNNNAFIQDVLPDVEIAVRERFMTGICGDCWNKLFNPDEEEV